MPYDIVKGSPLLYSGLYLHSAAGSSPCPPVHIGLYSLWNTLVQGLQGELRLFLPQEFFYALGDPF